MERRVTVNDRIERFELEVPPELEPLPEAASAGNAAAQGACLYFGPAGQRCSRPALAGGYCSRHRADGPDGEARSPARNYSRVLTATAAIVLIVWPYIADLVHDLIHWLSSPR